jgi:hypothetical protein
MVNIINISEELVPPPPCRVHVEHHVRMVKIAKVSEILTVGSGSEYSISIKMVKNY